MSEPRKKPGMAFWATVVVVALVLYVLSGSPAELLVMKMGGPDWLVVPGRIIYAPLAWAVSHEPEWVRRWDDAYDDWWAEVIFDENE